MDIPREFRPGQPPFNPVELAAKTARVVCKQIRRSVARKYTHFSVVRFYRGAATGFAVGCNLRCFFCWSHRARDYPEMYGEFYTPSQVVEKLKRLARSRGSRVARVSGGEPTICPDHLLEVLKLVDEEECFDVFVLETNGILIGTDPDLAKRIANSCSKLVVRVSIKAGCPDKFYERTGGEPSAWELPFRAIEVLNNLGVHVYPAVIVDPRIVTVDERRAIISRLASIDPRLAREIEEETIEPFPESLRRMKIYGLVIK